MNNEQKEVLLEIQNYKKYFGQLKAVDDISLQIYKGETLGVVGESGCGKSTLGKTIVGLHEATAGKLIYHGEEITKKNRIKYNGKLQLIFQDPFSSLNPRMTVFDLIAEPLRVLKMCKNENEVKARVYELTDTVGIRREYTTRYPHEFSGGQRQRIGIARALTTEPDFIVCDEPVSALDVSIKAQIINMFIDIQKEKNISYLFITHDLLSARYISDRIAVMYLGELMEIGSCEEIMDASCHPYTKSLLSAIALPDVDLMKGKTRQLPVGEIPSPMNKPSGCPYRTRCKFATASCAESRPQLQEVSSGHFVACFNWDKI